MVAVLWRRCRSAAEQRHLDTTQHCSVKPPAMMPCPPSPPHLPLPAPPAGTVLSCTKVQAFMLALLTWVLPSFVLRRLERQVGVTLFISHLVVVEPNYTRCCGAWRGRQVTVGGSTEARIAVACCCLLLLRRCRSPPAAGWLARHALSCRSLLDACCAH